MMDMRTFVSQMFTPGTTPCTIFGVVIGLVFAVLCLTIGFLKALLIGVFCLVGAFIGGVRDKKAFVRGIVSFFSKGDADRYE